MFVVDVFPFDEFFNDPEKSLPFCFLGFFRREFIGMA